MAENAPRGGKLSFKGDKKAAKTKKRNREEMPLEEAIKLDQLPEEEEDISGPMLVMYRTDEGIFALSAEKERGLFLSLLSSENVDIAEPEAVYQVLLINKLPASHCGQIAYSIKSHDEFYVSCDKYGVMTIEKTALGAMEEWILFKRPEGYSFKSAVHETFIQIDEEKQVIRADSKNPGYRETFKLRCQVQERRRRLEAKLDKKKKGINAEFLSPEEVEKEHLRKYQSFPSYSGMSADELKRAQEKGRLNEELLQRRIKTKTDKYCK